MSNLFTLSYWFSLQPHFFTPLMSKLILIFFIAFVIVSIAGYLFIMKRKVDKYVRRAIARASSLLLTMGLFGLLLYFFAYEQVPILSMRIWYIVWLAATLLWAWFIYKYVKYEIPAKKAMKEEREKAMKWLPKKSK